MVVWQEIPLDGMVNTIRGAGCSSSKGWSRKRFCTASTTIGADGKSISATQAAIASVFL